MNALFADTSFYVAIFSPQYSLHGKASSIRDPLDLKGAFRART